MCLFSLSLSLALVESMFVFAVEKFNRSLPQRESSALCAPTKTHSAGTNNGVFLYAAHVYKNGGRSSAQKHSLGCPELRT